MFNPSTLDAEAEDEAAWSTQRASGQPGTTQRKPVSKNPKTKTPKPNNRKKRKKNQRVAVRGIPFLSRGLRSSRSRQFQKLVNLEKVKTGSLPDEMLETQAHAGTEFDLQHHKENMIIRELKMTSVARFRFG